MRKTIYKIKQLDLKKHLFFGYTVLTADQDIFNNEHTKFKPTRLIFNNKQKAQAYINKCQQYN